MTTRPPLLRYGLLAVPLAFAGLPIYLHIPHLYATAYHMNLAKVGFILLGVRLLDAVQDPVIGLLSERSRFSRRQLITAASLPLMLGFIGLFNPPAWAQQAAMLPWWLAGMMILVYSAFTLMMIHYYASGMAFGEAAQTRVSAFREGGILLGVMLASALPSLFIEKLGFGETAGYHLFSLLLPPLLITGLLFSFTTISNTRTSPASRPPLREAVYLLKAAPIQRILLLFLCNALPTAITSTLFLFFVEDVLQAPHQSGELLLVYFVAAGISIPFWAWLGERIKPERALAMGMILAITSFIWTYVLQAGDVAAFFAICSFSGVAMGADVTLLPVLFAYALRDYPHHTAFAYSLWHALSKLTLALAAGIVLPGLAWWGYRPDAMDVQPTDVHALAVAYAVIPCALKAIALTILSKLPSNSLSAKESF